MTLPSVGFGEIVLFGVYLVVTHYFVRNRVKEEFSDFKNKIEKFDEKYDTRCDDLEYYLRRLEGVSAANQKIAENNSSLLENAAKVKDIIEQIDKKTPGEL